MAIQINCPACHAPFNLPETLRGKQVRCKNCQHTFVVGGPAAPSSAIVQAQIIQPPPSASKTQTGVRPPTQASAQSAAQAPVQVQVVATPPAGSTPVRAVALRDESRSTPVLEGEGKSGGSALWWVAGVFVLLLVVGGGIGAYFLLSKDDTGGDGPGGAGSKDELTQMLNDLRVDGLPRQVAVNKLYDLGKKEGATHPRRTEVYVTLQKVAQDEQRGDFKRNAEKAMLFWAGKENIRYLIDVIEHLKISPEHVALALEALGKLKEPAMTDRLIEHLIARPGQPAWHGANPAQVRAGAAKGLQNLGASAEQQVMEHLFHEDAGVRQHVREILIVYGTKKEVIVDQVLKAANEGKRREAAQWLADAKEPVAERREEVVKVLNDFFNDPALQMFAVRALGTWGTEANVPALARLLSQRHFAERVDIIKTLSRFRTAQAAEAIATQLPEFHHDYKVTALDALKSMGPMATEAVVKYVHHPRAGGEIKKLLEEWKTDAKLIIPQTLNDLASTDHFTKLNAITWLAEKCEPIDAYKAQVASAVGQLASDFHPDIKKMALKAQGKWGVLSITQLMGQLNSNDFGVRHAAIQALAVTKKPEAAEAIAARLQDGFDRRTAVEALRSMGSVAEPAVVKYMHHYDAGVAQEVRSLLIGYGTKDDVLLTQTLKDLFFPKVEVCRSAVKWFAEGRQIDKSRRHEVMKAFNRLPIVVYTFKDKEILQNFLVALERLGGDENLKGIILQLNDEKEGVRQEAMSSLAKSKHPRALDVLARELTNKKNRADAAKALREAGSEAEGVIVVVMDQFIADPTLLLEGCRILEEIGTKDSLQLLYKIGGLYQKSNKGLYNAADKAARAIAKRESMGGVRLLDLDVPIRLGVLVRPVLTWRSLEVREHLLS